MGGGSTTTGSSSSHAKIPSWLKPLLQNTAKEWLTAQGNVPSLSQLYGSVPMLQVPNLTGAQESIISQMEGLGNAAYDYLGGGPAPAAGSNTPSATPGFSKGGSFDIPGVGNKDSHLVQFLARPGEKVTVTTPEQQAMLKLLGVPGFASGGNMTVGGKGTGSYGGTTGGGKGTGNPPSGGTTSPAGFGPAVPSGGKIAHGYGPALPSNPSQPTPNPNSGPTQLSTNGGFQWPSGNGVLDPQQLAASNTLSSFLGTPGTPSAATQAAMKEWADLQAPQILQSASNMGLGNSGAALQALALGQESAAVPFLQGDLSNTLNATGQLGQIGAQGAQQAQQQIANALQAAGLPYEVAMQQAQALFNQQSTQWNFANQLQMGPANLFGNLFGTTGTQQQTTTPSKF